MIQLIRGFKDILPDDIHQWQHIEQTARNLFESFGFTEIRPALLEKTDLFKRSIGEDTDIVGKEMYTFADRKGDSVTLRPEATASVVRSYIQHKMYAQDPVRKLYTIGPMFRRERPQKGRYRQFYQINAEAFGIESPLMDAQLIFMLVKLFEQLSIDDTTAHINSLGCPECRPGFKKILAGYLESKKEALCENCRSRMTRNPLRVLDCKVPSCRKALDAPPEMTSYLCGECDRHFTRVKTALNDYNIPFKLNKNLVRGLDYYSRTTFEIQTLSLGAQSAIAGGGRYDGLVEMLGGPPHPAIGFAIGFDRLVELFTQQPGDKVKGPDVFLAPLGETCEAMAGKWAAELSLSGIRTEIDFSGKSLKSLMKRANRLQAGHVLIAGEDEIENGSAILRNLHTKEQVDIPLADLSETIKMKIKL